MHRLALQMLIGDRPKHIGLLFGIAFTSFLVTFAGSYFCGFMTRGFALIAENPVADVWIMDSAIQSTEQTVNMPASVLNRVRSVDGVRYATPLLLGAASARFANGAIQPLQIIGVDDATLSGAPVPEGGGRSTVLHFPDAAIAAPGGTEGKLIAPRFETDRWTKGAPHLNTLMRSLSPGDEVVVNNHRVKIEGLSDSLPRFPPRPLLYMTFSNALRVLPPERHMLTFVLATAKPGVPASTLAARIEAETGLRARTSADFKADTVWWFLLNSEDVGDVASMLTLAITVGFGMTGVMLYMFTTASLRQYATLKAMGASTRLLLSMILVQAGFSALVGTGLGLGLCGIAGQIAASQGYPFRMMWFTPLFGGGMVLLVSVAAAVMSSRPVLKLQPGIVFAGR